MAGPATFLGNAFLRVFGAAASMRVYRAPGRVNLIGEHTDYNLGFVLPMALELACYTGAAPRPDGRLRVFSENLGEAREWAVAELPGLQPAGDWGDYVAGVARELLAAGCEVRPQNLLVWSTVPVGSGLSSSAALEVSVALALAEGRAMDGLDLARLCRRAENNFVGAPCGIMDQYVSVFGRENAAIRIDCRSLEHQPVALPPGMAIMAVNTLVKHEIGQSAYRQRVEECKAAAEALGVQSLRDVTSAELEQFGDALPVVPLRRALHVVTENERVGEFMTACAREDLAAMGKLFVASHRSLQRDYEVSCEELDFLVDTALELPGVLGARMTGGGFGGCTVNLVRQETAAVFGPIISRAYQQRFGLAPQVYPCRAAAGASEVPLSAR
ncbi:MAG: galactokinase [Acidobacteriota bacterium]